MGVSMRIWLAALLAGVLMAPAVGQSTDTPALLPGESVVRVESRGFIERMPDTLDLTIGIRSQGDSAKAVADANAAKLQRLVADLRSLGIEESWTSAKGFNAGPVYAENANGREDRSRIVGFRATQTISVELRDLSRFQEILGRLAQEELSDISANFELKDRRKAELEAQRVAISNARAEAENIASALGKRVGRLLLIANEREGYRGWKDLGDSITVTGSRIQPLELKPTPVTVDSTVYVDWSLIDR